MSQHKGAKPSAQPRSLRSIAESQNSASLFVDGEGPGEAEIKQPVAHDVAEAARPSEGQARRGLTPADPRPFGTLRG